MSVEKTRQHAGAPFRLLRADLIGANLMRRAPGASFYGADLAGETADRSRPVALLALTLPPRRAPAWRRRGEL